MSFPSFFSAFHRQSPVACFLQAYGVLTVLWLFALRPLMIADVWDETNILLILGELPGALPERLLTVWTRYLGLYRPLAASLLVLLDQAGAGLVGFRYFNAVLLAIAFGLLGHVMVARFALAWPRALLVVAGGLLGSASLIGAGWFANVFDVSCLLLVAVAVALIAAGRPLAAGFALGAAFYCKEIALLGLPLAPWLLWRLGRPRLAELARVLVPALLLAAIYFYLRQRLTPLGGAADIHQFAPGAYPGSLRVMLEAFWWQHTRFVSGDAQAWLGLALSAGFFLALRGWADRALVAATLLLTSLACWGMFQTQGDILISGRNFIGRLFLLPGAIALLALAAGAREGGRWRVAVFVLPLVVGAAGTALNHARFQTVYERIYREAASSASPLRVAYDQKTLDDPRRRLRIGAFSDAALTVEPRRGCLARPGQAPLFCAISNE